MRFLLSHPGRSFISINLWQASQSQGFHMCHLPDYFIQLSHNRNSHLEVRIFDALRMSDLHHNYLITYAKQQSSQFINYSIINEREMLNIVIASIG